MTSELAAFLGIPNTDHMDGRPGAAPPRPETPPTPKPAPTVNANDIAYAAREAVHDVLPANWHQLPDGRNTANVLAGTIANHYARPSTGEKEIHG
ncbi:hypothetical protein AB4Y77_00070 [Paenarthrobacter sp. YAF11_1]|uniref:hypothetical protein n=1 Tax=Paenarthrobacter sp. YAF11_1 TaxID=3233074 RepID=UPI003F96F388